MKNDKAPIPSINPFQPPGHAGPPHSETSAGDQTFTIGDQSRETTPDLGNDQREEVVIDTANDGQAIKVEYTEYEQALITQYREFFPVIAGWLVRKTGTKHPDAEDATQEAFLIAWRKRNELEKGGDPGNSGLQPGWLFTTAFNTLRSTWSRNSKRETTNLDDIPEIFESDGADYRATQELVLQAIATLSARKREITARLLIGMSNTEIGAELGINTSTVQSLKALLRREIQAKLQERGLDISHYRRKSELAAVDDGLTEG